MAKVNDTALLNTKDKVNLFNTAVYLLNKIDMDGETAELLLHEISMHEQVKKQFTAMIVQE